MTPRAALRALGMILALSLVTLPAVPVSARGSAPTDAIVELFDDLASGRFTEASRSVCAGMRTMAARRLDLTSMVRDVPAASRAALSRLFTVRITSVDLTLLDEEADAAVVRVAATITASLDESRLDQTLQALDWPATTLDSAIRRSVTAQRIRDRLASLPSRVQLDGEVEVVREGGTWKVCSDLGWGIEPLDPADVCALLSPSELRILAPLDLPERTAEPGVCTYSAASGSEQLSTVQVRLDDGDLALVHAAFPGGTVLTLDGMEAYATTGSVWVDLGGKLLTIQPALIGSPPDVDPERLALAIASVVVPRIDR